MTADRSPWLADVLPKLLAGHDLPAERIAEGLAGLIDGSIDAVEGAVFLVALRMKGESADEIAAAAALLRTRMICLTSTGTTLDTCGTGGDGVHTFNISTATAFVVAGAGVKVVKHGNRSVSSKSGSADVLRELGVPHESGPAWAQHCLDTIGFAFCYAPQFHPAMAALAPLRRKLGIPTLFNLLGPLMNPAGSSFQLLGVGSADRLERLAQALRRLGTERAYLVHGCDGLDEVTLGGMTRALIVEGDAIREEGFGPADFGLAPVDVSELRVADAIESAAVVRGVLEGKPGPAERVVLANAAVALRTVGVVTDLREGVALARSAIHNGSAQRVLQRLRGE